MAREVQGCKACGYLPGSGRIGRPRYPHDLPWKRSRARDGDIQLEWLLARNQSALVFDFEYPALGIGNSLHGFTQAVSWALVGGLPIFLLEPAGDATVNSLCYAFECGFPLIKRELLFGTGAPHQHRKHVFPPTPTSASFALLHSRPDKPFKVVSFKSNIRLHPCLVEAFYTSPKPCGKQNAHDASICWQINVLRSLLPRLSSHAVMRLEALPKQMFHGDLSRVLQIAREERESPHKLHSYFPAIHIRTLLPAIETYSSIKGAVAAARFQANLEFLANSSDFCIFGSQAMPSEGKDFPRDVFIASDSMELKKLMSARWESTEETTNGGAWRLHYFISPGVRLRARRAIKQPGEFVTDAMLLTLVELWYLSRSRPLIGLAFFDIRLGEKLLLAEQEGNERSAIFKTVSTFAKGASLLGGLETATEFAQCASIGRGNTAIPIGRPINKACSVECREST
jgi:hypothetical protein